MQVFFLKFCQNLVKNTNFKTVVTVGMGGMLNCKFFTKYCYLFFCFEGYNMSSLNRKSFERSDGEEIILERERD